MGFNEVGKAAMDVIKESQERAKEVTKDVDKRIDVSKTLSDHLTKNDDKAKINNNDNRVNIYNMKFNVAEKIIDADALDKKITNYKI